MRVAEVAMEKVRSLDRVIGIRNERERFNWVVIEGSSRSDAVVLDAGELNAPSGLRPEQLAWVRRELLEVINRFKPNVAAVRVAEGAQAGAPNFARAEIDGVVQGTLGELSIPVNIYKSASVRSAFGKTKPASEAAQIALPLVSGTAKVRREQLIVALASLEDK